MVRWLRFWSGMAMVGACLGAEQGSTKEVRLVGVDGLSLVHESIVIRRWRGITSRLSDARVEDLNGTTWPDISDAFGRSLSGAWVDSGGREISQYLKWPDSSTGPRQVRFGLSAVQLRFWWKGDTTLP